jgi:hypothetical protein
VRVVFNDGLRLREQVRLARGQYVSNGGVQKAVITEAKKTDERAWLGEVSSVLLVQAVNDLHRAYRNFFDSLKGQAREPQGRAAQAPFEAGPAIDPAHPQRLCRSHEWATVCSEGRGR